jgi:coenzyme F420-reducing hydrogenase beta subunit
MLRSPDRERIATASGHLLAPADVIRSGLCIGCGSCVARAHRSRGDTSPSMVFDRYGQLVPAASKSWLQRPSPEFASTCPFSPFAADEDELAAGLFPATRNHTSAGSFEAAYVGHVVEDGFRAAGSSGGMVSWVLAELFRRGSIDGAAHVVASDASDGGRFFRYRISRAVDEVRAGAKSRYYPIDMAEVIREIRDVPGRYAVVGIPCFIKAVQLLRREDPVLRDRIVATLGLFCGHMKSARFVESFAWQMEVPIADVRAVEFRQKDASRPASTYTAQLELRNGTSVKRDWWNLVDGDWGAGFFQHSACNACDDVVAETADISFGDAWVEPYSSDGNGTNVIVVRTPLLAAIVVDGIADRRLALEPVDGGFVERTQSAGLRQRREGLAYRLTWRRLGLRPRKRVAASRNVLLRRKLIYRSRSAISWWSHRIFWLSAVSRRPHLYLRWAGAVQVVYHALTYSRGRLGVLVDRWLPKP